MLNVPTPVIFLLILAYAAGIGYEVLVRAR